MSKKETDQETPNEQSDLQEVLDSAEDTDVPEAKRRELDSSVIA